MCRAVAVVYHARMAKHKHITADQVIRTAQFTYDQASRRLVADERLAHARGYHWYSTLLANMRNDFEKAYLKLIAELESEVGDG